MEFLADFSIGGVDVFAPANQFSAEASAHTAIGVPNRLGLILEPESCMEMKRFFKRPDVEGRLLLWGNAIRGGDRHDKERIHSRAGTEAVVPAGELAERTDAKLREPVAHFLGERKEVRDDHLRFALKSR